jgi:spermidine synthase
VYRISVIPTVVVDRTLVPGGELVLSRRKDEWSIRVRGVELMNSRNHQSEDELGRMTCARVATLPAARLLVGGLGFGFTLRAALDALPAAARVEVVEIVPALVRWNRELLGELAGHPLADPRVTVTEADVAEVIRGATAAYDAILLDVDNGPDGVYEGNAGLYKRTGLEAAHAALAPGGVLAVWSAFNSATFTTWLRNAGFTVDLQTIRPFGARHYIWFATKN